ncbi:MAG: GyrI-like domain-containing protein [Sedimentisphaerales bacterium]|nr:GyrI-like domain-containing protein [Sedimentisphaerales bacterium]
MKKNVILIVLSILILSEIIFISGLCLCKGQNKNSTDISIREIPQQTVLYTIYRGSHFKIGKAINELYALAEEKGIQTYGNVSTCFLNSPVTETCSHQIIEIQIPVEDIAINQSGTLGNMTDIKQIPAMKVAVAVKPEGFNDPTSVLTELFTWINKKGYVVRGRMRQSIQNENKGYYKNLRTEFLIPIDKINYKDFPTLTINPCYM